MENQIDYDLLKQLARNQKFRGESGSPINNSFGAFIGPRIPIFGPRLPGGDPFRRPSSPLGIPEILIENLGKLLEDIFSGGEKKFGEDDLENIHRIIDKAIRRGKEQIEIRISRDLGEELGLEGRLNDEQWPDGVDVKLVVTKSGDYILKVKIIQLKKETSFNPRHIRPEKYPVDSEELFENKSGETGHHLKDAEALVRFYQLYQQGALTEEEYLAKKREILK